MKYVYQLVYHENDWTKKRKCIWLFLSSKKRSVHTSLCQFIFALWELLYSMICESVVGRENDKKKKAWSTFLTGILNHPKWISCLLHFLFFKILVFVCHVYPKLWQLKYCQTFFILISFYFSVFCQSLFQQYQGLKRTSALLHDSSLWTSGVTLGLMEYKNMTL